jgi:hypothetical protein
MNHEKINPEIKRTHKSPEISNERYNRHNQINLSFSQTKYRYKSLNKEIKPLNY